MPDTPDNGLTCECGHDVAYHVTSLAPSACWAACEAACREFKSAELRRLQVAAGQVLGQQHVLRYAIRCIRHWLLEPNFNLQAELLRVEDHIVEWHKRLVTAMGGGCSCGASLGRKPEHEADCVSVQPVHSIREFMMAEETEIAALKAENAKLTKNVDKWRSDFDHACKINDTLREENAALRTKLAARDGLVEELKAAVAWFAPWLLKDGTACFCTISGSNSEKCKELRALIYGEEVKADD